ncbi:MAG: M23 family metallopeptidase [Syntrophales bacterium]|nr:M23 family metallopeptidase [Syntrophales bacterium]
MFQSRKIIVLLLICWSFSACMPWAAEWTRGSYKAKQAKGVYHRIKSGETLSSIARAYYVSVQDLAEINNLSDPNIIEVGGVIFIPDANQVIENIIPSAGKSEVSASAGKKQAACPVVKPLEEGVGRSQVSVKEELPASTQKREGGAAIEKKAKLSKIPPPISEEKNTPKAVRKDAPSEERPVNSHVEDKSGLSVKQKTGCEREQAIQFDRKRFIWPVKGNVIARFGIQPNGMYYNGVTIAAKEGTPVLSAGGGAVIFSASLKDYGETMIIKHEDSYTTVYTNLGRRTRKVDDKVLKGEQIALTGKSKKGEPSYICFEIRHKNKARNPLFFLP